MGIPESILAEYTCISRQFLCSRRKKVCRSQVENSEKVIGWVCHFSQITPLPAGLGPEKNLAGARIDVDDYEKDDARDFVLWKAPKEGEPVWETDLGPGRPGWHIECSAMAMALLGETFDIHCGGVDNIFPHHENEIAQSEGATGCEFARFWLHAEHLVVEGEKMAKRVGNFFTLRDLMDKGFDPLVVRYLLISVPYRQRLNFTFDGLHTAEQAIDRITNTLRRLENTPPAAGAGDLDQAAIDEFYADFRGALGDDLNTARALAALHTLLRVVNTALDGDGLSLDMNSVVGTAFAEADSVLGIFPKNKAEAGTDSEIDALIEERKAARENRDFARADAIRDELAAKGIALEDTPHGTVWHRE